MVGAAKVRPEVRPKVGVGVGVGVEVERGTGGIRSNQQVVRSLCRIIDEAGIETDNDHIA